MVGTMPPNSMLRPNAGSGSGDGSAASQTGSPQSDWHPDYCGSTLFKLVKMANDLGEFGDKVSTAFVVSGGTGLVPALGFKAVSGLAQVGGALQALAGVQRLGDGQLEHFCRTASCQSLSETTWLISWLTRFLDQRWMSSIR